MDAYTSHIFCLQQPHVDVKSLKELLFIFLLYPGVGQRVFQVFDCRTLQGAFSYVRTIV